MKAEELQICDWITISKFKENGTDINVKVYGIGVDVVLTKTETGVNPYELSQVKPIPLTDDILKLNGWKDSQYSNILKVYRDGEVYMEIRADNLAIWLNVDGEEPIDIYADYILPRPKYVHTLQHCLRLVGMNDLADNWRVE